MNDIEICLQKQIMKNEFYALLIVHLGIILVNNQLDSQFLSLYVYFNSLHVSSNLVLIIRRINGINTTFGICHFVQVTACTEWHIPDSYNWFSWWWAQGCLKHVENWNEHIRKGIVRQVGYLQELWRMNFKAKNTFYCPAFVNNSQLFKEEYEVWS
jgi:hypothetical protein